MVPVQHMMTSSNGNIFQVTGPLRGESTGFPSQRPVTRSFDVFFDLRLNKRLSKQIRRRWYETSSRSLLRTVTICAAHVFDWRANLRLTVFSEIIRMNAIVSIDYQYFCIVKPVCLVEIWWYESMACQHLLWYFFLGLFDRNIPMVLFSQWKFKWWIFLNNILITVQLLYHPIH